MALRKPLRKRYQALNASPIIIGFVGEYYDANTIFMYDETTTFILE